MKHFFCLLFTCLFAVSLCACAKPAQPVALTPFSAELSFTEDGTHFAGVFRYDAPTQMELLLRAPSALQGLRFVWNNGETHLMFGDAALSLKDAERLALRPASVAALFSALSLAGDGTRQTDETLTLSVNTTRGTAELHFDEACALPLFAQLGGVRFDWTHNP